MTGTFRHYLQLTEQAGKRYRRVLRAYYTLRAFDVGDCHLEGSPSTNRVECPERDDRGVGHGLTRLSWRGSGRMPFDTAVLVLRETGWAEKTARNLLATSCTLAQGVRPWYIDRDGRQRWIRLESLTDLARALGVERITEYQVYPVRYMESAKAFTASCVLAIETAMRSNYARLTDHERRQLADYQNMRLHGKRLKLPKWQPLQNGIMLKGELALRRGGYLGRLSQYILSDILPTWQERYCDPRPPSVELRANFSRRTLAEISQVSRRYLRTIERAVDYHPAARHSVESVHVGRDAALARANVLNYGAARFDGATSGYFGGRVEGKYTIDRLNASEWAVLEQETNLYPLPAHVEQVSIYSLLSRTLKRINRRLTGFRTPAGKGCTNDHAIEWTLSSTNIALAGAS